MAARGRGRNGNPQGAPGDPPAQCPYRFALWAYPEPRSDRLDAVPLACAGPCGSSGRPPATAPGLRVNQERLHRDHPRAYPKRSRPRSNQNERMPCPPKGRPPQKSVNRGARFLDMTGATSRNPASGPDSRPRSSPRDDHRPLPADPVSCRPMHADHLLLAARFNAAGQCRVRLGRPRGPMHSAS